MPTRRSPRKYSSIRSYHRFLGDRGTLPAMTRRWGSTRHKDHHRYRWLWSIDEIARILGSTRYGSAGHRSQGQRGARDALCDGMPRVGTYGRSINSTSIQRPGRCLLTREGEVNNDLCRLGSYALNCHRAVAAGQTCHPAIGDGHRSALFLTVRGNRMSRQSVWRLVKRYGVSAAAIGS